jgi:hypothetical protein
MIVRWNGDKSPYMQEASVLPTAHPITADARLRSYARKIAILTAAVSVWSLPAVAEGLQFQCGTSSGHSFYADQGLAEGQGGWSEDGIADGEIVVRIDLDEAKASVRFRDATGEWSDASDLGETTEIWHVQASPLTFGVSVVYSGPSATTMEAYTLAEIDLEQRTAK